MWILCTQICRMKYIATLRTTEFLISLSCHLITQMTLVLTAYQRMYNFFCQKPLYFVGSTLKFNCSGRNSKSSELQQSWRRWRSRAPSCWRGTGCWSGSCTAVITSCRRRSQQRYFEERVSLSEEQGQYS